ncbi:Protein pob1 [Schizosaccharomyces pombe]
MDEEFGDGWWEGEDEQGNRGIFPASHVELISDERSDSSDSRRGKEDFSISTAEVTRSSLSSSRSTSSRSDKDSEKLYSNNSLSSSHSSILNGPLDSLSKPSVPSNFNSMFPSSKQEGPSPLLDNQPSSDLSNFNTIDADYNNASASTSAPATSASLKKVLSAEDSVRETITDIETALQNMSTSASRTPNDSSPLPYIENRPASSLAVSEKIQNVPNWSTEEVVEWLMNAGLGSVAPNFAENEITGEILLGLDSNVLKELNITSFGKRFEVLRKIQQLKDSYEQSLYEEYPQFAEPISVSQSSDSSSSIPKKSNDEAGGSPSKSSPTRPGFNDYVNRPTSVMPSLSNMIVSPDLDSSPSTDWNQYVIPPLATPSSRNSKSTQSAVPENVSRFDSNEPSATSPILKRSSPTDSISQNSGLPSRLTEPISSPSTSSIDVDKEGTSFPGLPYHSSKGNLYAPQPSSNVPTKFTGGASESSSVPPRPIPSAMKGKAPASAISIEALEELDPPKITTIDGESPSSISSRLPSSNLEQGSSSSVTKSPESMPDPSAKASSPVTSKGVSINEKSAVNNYATPLSKPQPKDTKGSKLGNTFVAPSPAASLPASPPVGTELKTRPTLRSVASSPLNKEPIGKRKSKRDIFGRQKVLPTGISEGLSNIPAKEAIKTADCHGWMRKRSDRYGVWKSRYFVLKGTRLSYYHSLNDASEKGLIDMTSHRVTKTDDIVLSGGKTAIKLIPPAPGAAKAAVMFTPPKVHYFTCENNEELHRWSSAFLKATVERDMSVPVLTTSRMPTISLSKAKELRTRPPSLLIDDENEANLTSSIGLKKNAKQKNKKSSKQK